MTSILKLILSFMLSLAQILSPVAAQLGGESKYFENWSPESEYTASYAQEIEKKPGKDFVILNITDVQLEDYEVYGKNGELAKKTIDKLVNDVKPDLITMTGDNGWGTMAYIELIKQLDSYGIPWAPIMGNHDGQGLLSEFWGAYKFTQAKNCLFRFGPKDMGYGNYVINITQNGHVVHTIFMMDTHSDATFETESGKVSGYDHLWSNQMQWYKWVLDGVAKQEGKTVESSVFFHIPVCEYAEAWKAASIKTDTDTSEIKDGPYNDEYKDVSFGKNGEDVCCSPVNNGFFELCRSLGSTKNMICGHDHVNNSSILYKGIRLTYGMKTGSGCYWDNGMNGGTKLTVASDGSMLTEHIYVDPAEVGYSSQISIGDIC
ncbi:MAG: metallophosphoesterase [Acutalibacteraceae bacterium]